MKKLLSCFLVVVLLLSFGISGYAAGQSNEDGQEAAIFSDPVNISAQTGLNIGQDGFHSGHQTRIVHTSHGDYIAILTDRLKDDNNIQLNEFSIIKVVDGEATVLYQDYQSYCTSSISIFQDENGEVYASAIVSNKYNDEASGCSVNLSIWHIDAQTDEVNGYKTTLKNATAASYGYEQPVIDTVNNKIYAVLSRGNGDNDGYLHWFIFDLDTMSWEPGEYSIECKDRWRFMYHYLFADGEGGMYMVTQRNALAENLGYPEIPSSPVWPASYVWDALAYYYIPDVYDDSEYYFQYIEEPDYSRVKDLDGDGKRDSMEERLTNQYPTVVNNHQGDTYVDSNGLLHVLYTVGYNQCAYDRSVAFESTLWHVTYDLSDKTAPKLLSKEQLFFDSEIGNNNLGYEFRMTEGTDGTLFIVCVDLGDENKDYFQLYKLTKKNGGGYDYILAGRSANMGAGWGFSLSNLRSVSTMDGKAAILFESSSNRMAYTLLTLPTNNTSLTITTTDLGNASVGKAYEASISVDYDGEAALTYSAEGLPEGLTIDSVTGKISGVPAVGADKDSPYTVKVTVTDGQLTATAELSLNVYPQGQFVITVIKSKGGMVIPTGGKVTVPEGESKTFVFVADNGYKIADVLVDGKSMGAVTKYTFENVMADHTLQVKFVKKYIPSDSGSSDSSGSSGADSSGNSGDKDNVDTGAVL